MEIYEHFSLLNTESMQEYCALPDVSMEPLDLFRTKMFFDGIQHCAPSIGELILLDSFIGAIGNSANRYAAVSIRANDAHVAKPLLDIIRSRQDFHPDEGHPCTLGEAFHTVTESVDHQKMRSFSTSDRRIFISDSDDNARLTAITNGYLPELCENGICIAKNTYDHINNKEIRWGKEYSAVVVYPREESGLDRIYGFAKKISRSKKAMSVSVSRGKDVFRNLYFGVSSKLTVRAERLGLLLKEDVRESFVDVANALFTDSLFGSTAITVICKKKQAEKVLTLARQMGLATCTAIEIAKAPKLKLFFNRLLLSELRNDALSNIGAPKPLSVEIPQSPTGEASFPEVTRLCEFSDNGDTVYSVSLPISHYGYQNATLAVISPLVSAAFDGFNLKNSCFSLAARVSADLSSKESVSEAYSALASLHGVTSELGFPFDCISTSVTDEPSSISVLLRVAPFEKKASLSSSLSADSITKLAFAGGRRPDVSFIYDLIRG